MSNTSAIAKQYARSFGLWLLDHDNKIFGVALALIALDDWRMMYARFDEYWVYLMYGIYATPVLSLLSIAFSTFYVSTISIILLTARKPVARYETLAPNVLAVLAGFGVYAFGLLEPAETRPFGVLVPLVLLVSGAAIVLLALFYLRRAFSVTPQARTVVRSGPYAVVRHPMYVGNILSIAGWGLVIGTPQALLLSLFACALQVWRARYEDRLLAKTFADYGAHMSNVNGFVPRFGFLKSIRVSLLFVPIVFSFLDHQASAQTRAGNSAELGAKCRAWHQKALAGQWFTKAEGQAFVATESMQDTLSSIPGCKEFFALQDKCQGVWVESVSENPGSRAAKRKAAALLDAIESVPGCKPIIGFQDVCDAVRAGAKSGPRLSPKLQSVLQECADGSIANRTSSMLRPAL
jgi:protein-S-isoprenylcysteine O-methyltransferase Ste14